LLVRNHICATLPPVLRPPEGLTEHQVVNNVWAWPAIPFQSEILEYYCLQKSIYIHNHAKIKLSRKSLSSLL